MGPLGGSWEPLEGFLESLEPLRGLLGVIWVILGAAGRIRGSLGALLEPLGSVLGGSWEHFGGILVLYCSNFGAWEASLKRFAEILKTLKNDVRYCKNRGSEGQKIMKN